MIYTCGVTQIISIVGPESSGKTTLAQALANRFHAPLVEEYARAYLSGRPSYDETDLDTIARGQLALEEAALKDAPPVLVLDTDMLVIEVWWLEKYGEAPDWVETAIRAQRDRTYLLVRPDLPWEPDPLRESKYDRERLFEVYRIALAERAAAFDIVGGSGRERLRWALESLERRGVVPVAR